MSGTYVSLFHQAKIREFHVFLFIIGVAIGSFGGPLFSGIISQQKGYTLTFCILGVLLFVSICPVLFLSVKEKSNKSIKDSKIDTSVIGFLKQPGLRKAFLISALVLLGKEMYIAYFPLLAAEKEISNALIGLIVSINAGAGVLIRLLLPVTAQKCNRFKFIFFFYFSNWSYIRFIHYLITYPCSFNFVFTWYLFGDWAAVININNNK